MTESTSLILRAEFFNAFNHTQFSALNGNVITANFPRIMQFTGKFQF